MTTIMLEPRMLEGEEILVDPILSNKSIDEPSLDYKALIRNAIASGDISDEDQKGFLNQYNANPELYKSYAGKKPSNIDKIVAVIDKETEATLED